MCHDRTADSQRQPENTMPKHRAPMLVRALVLSTAAGILSGCALRDPDYAHPRPESHASSSYDRHGSRAGFGVGDGGNELAAIVFAAIYAPFIIADMLDEIAHMLDELLNTPR